MKNIAIVGGGTAGWITALYAKKIYPEYNIFLIYSKEIGILGAGEGSTPHLISLLDFLNIPVNELIKNCNSTIKNGIKFTNWKNNSYYYHPFFNFSNASEQQNNFYYKEYEENEKNIFCLFETIKKTNIKYFTETISEQNKVPFKEKFLENNFKKNNPIDFFDQLATWSIHFDANSLATYLEKIGTGRGIKTIAGNVKKINVDDKKNIKSLFVEDTKILVDFVFDCTGFKRLIIGNFYKSKWKSHSQHLPAKRALPFFLPMDKEIPPYTEAIAMNYGWMWKIPVQNRYGCGYVFDSDFISDDEAKREIDEYLGFEVESPRTFSFNAGCYEEIWINNCLAVGLSAGFIEPLEATSIWQTILSLKNFFSDKNNIFTKNIKIKNNYNNIYFNQTQEIVDFLYLHYITKKNNLIFWKNFNKNNKMPDFIDYIINVSTERIINDNIDFRSKTMFSALNYLYVLDGNGLIKKSTKLNYLKNIKKQDIESLDTILKNIKILSIQSIDHNYFLNFLKNN